MENSSIVRTIFRSSNGLDKLTSYHMPDAPTTFPIHYPSTEQLSNPEITEEELKEILNNTQGSLDNTNDFRFNTIKDYYTSYMSKKITPNQVCENLIKALNTNECKKLCAIVEWDEELIREQAEESTKRFENNSPRSILEGIPISVKDQIHVKGLITCKGRHYGEKATC